MLLRRKTTTNKTTKRIRLKTGMDESEGGGKIGGRGLDATGQMEKEPPLAPMGIREHRGGRRGRDSQ